MEAVMAEEESCLQTASKARGEFPEHPHTPCSPGRQLCRL